MLKYGNWFKPTSTYAYPNSSLVFGNFVKLDLNDSKQSDKSKLFSLAPIGCFHKFT